MRTDYIHEFLALAVELNFTRTAKSLHLSTSVLSKHMAALEKELGTLLFERGHSSVALTQAGRAFYEGMVPIHEEYRRFMADFDKAYGRAKDAKSFRIVVFGHEPSVLRPLPKIKEHLSESFNIDLRFSLVESKTPSPSVAVNEGMISYRHALPEDDSVALFDIMHDPLVAIVHSTHPLASRESVSLLDDIAHRKLVSLGGDYFATGKKELDAVLRQHGITNPVYSRSLATTIEELVYIDEFKGVLLFPKSSSLLFEQSGDGKFAVLPIKEESAHFTLAFACNAMRAKEAFISFTVSELRKGLGRRDEKEGA